MNMAIVVFMTKQVCIRNELYKNLKQIKGDGSFSDLIESLLNKSGFVPVHEPTRLQTEMLKR